MNNNNSYFKSIILAIFTIVFFQIIVTGEDSPLNLTNQQVANYNFRSHNNNSFGYGERLDYKIGYKFITAGTGFLEIAPKPLNRFGRNAYQVHFEARSLESLDWLYKVRDIFVTALDVNGIFPWDFTQKVREGRYKRDSKSYFNNINNVAHFKDSIFTIPPYVHDIISAFYYVRTLDLNSYKNGSIIYLDNFFDGKTYKLGVKIHRREICEVYAGKFNCIVIEPLIKEGGLFNADGAIYIWLTNDDRKMPIKVAAKIPIGFVEAKLSSYNGLRGPLTSIIK